MAQKFSDAARATLVSGIAAGDTSITLNSGNAFPVANTGTSTISESADWFKLVLQDNSKFEIVYARTHVAGASVISDLLRGQEGTTASAFAATSVVGLRQTAMDAVQYAATKVALESHVGSGGAAHADATGSVDGFMSAADKTKLDGVAAGANNYAHPANHPANIITQDASNRFVTDAEKTSWNAKQAAGNYATGGGTATGTNTGDQILPTLASLGAQAAGTYASGTGSASGVNTGDETLATIKTKLGITTLSGSNTGDQVLPTTLPASDVYAWAKAAAKPAYTATEVGLGNVPNLVFSGSNTGDETTATIKTKLGITTLSGANTGDQTIPTTLPASDVYAWAKAATKPSYTPAEIGSPSGSGSSTGTNTGDQTNISGNSASANRLVLNDTRAINPGPETYTMGITSDFKQNSVDGLADGGTYHSVSTVRQWTDFSGGLVHQLGYTDNQNIWYRAGTDIGTWGAWKRLAMAVDITGTNTGTNTGDETGATIRTKLGVTTLSGSNTGDQTIPTTLPASDVYAWAKAATKPSYTAAEVGAQVAGSYATGTGSVSGVNTGDQTNISGNAATATSATDLTGTVNSLGYSLSAGSVSYGGHGGPQVRDTSGGAAMMSFHRQGVFAINFGLDTDNVLKVGGWSMGAVAHTLYHSGNFAAGSQYQAPLVSGTNIKTVNGISLLGSGDLVIAGGVTSVNGLTGVVTIDIPQPLPPFNSGII